MAIYVFNKGEEHAVKFVSNSLKNEGLSRFGWSYFDSADLKELKDKPWSEMNSDEIETWNKTKFLLDIKPEDWVIHINLPSWGLCTAAKVVEGYFFEKQNNEISDFRHCLKIDKNTIIEFDRNAKEVHPHVSSRLKLQGKYWRLYAEKEFFGTIDNIKNGISNYNENNSIGLNHLKDEFNEILENLAYKIHKTHPEKKLEYLVCDLFKKIPNVTESYVNGSGWGTDFGADVVVKYNSGIGLLNLQKEEILVIQVKSYEGQHWSLDSVAQIKTAIEKFNANCGLIVTTAKSTSALEEAVDKLSKEIDKPIGLLSGVDLAKLFLKYENGMIVEI